MSDTTELNILFTVEPEPESMDVESTPVEQHADDLHIDMSLGTLVELTWHAKKAYGTIRWIGKLPGAQETMAGLELVI